MKVRANADTPGDAKKALEFGAEGIGLCRTEHMFMQDGRLELMQDMILSEDEDAPRSRSATSSHSAWRLRGDLRGDGRPAR